MSGKKLQLKYLSIKDISNTEEPHTELAEYFQILITILMTATFITLILIFLNSYYGKEEKETEKD